MTQLLNTQSGRPEGPISVIRQLSYECSKDGAFYSFEQRTKEVTLVGNCQGHFICVTEDSCAAEANGRPVFSHTEHYYTVTDTDLNSITAGNWKEKVVRPVAYSFHRVGEGITGEKNHE